MPMISHKAAHIQLISRTIAAPFAAARVAHNTPSVAQAAANNHCNTHDSLLRDIARTRHLISDIGAITTYSAISALSGVMHAT